MVSFLGQAQIKDSIADALKLQIKQADSDSLRINLKLDLAGRMALFDIDTAVVIIKNVQKQIKNIDKNSSFYKKTNTTILKSLANAETIKENLANALEYQIQAINYNIKIKDSVGLGIAYTGLGTIYLKLKDFSAAEKNIRLALTIQKKHSTPKEYSYSHIKLGHVLIMKKELDSAIMIFNKAKKIDTSKQKIISIESNLATIYKSQNKYEKVLEINKRILKLTDQKDYSKMGVYYGNLAHTYGLLNDWKNALKAVDSCIYFYKSIGKKQQLKLAYKFKADYLHHLENYKEAYNTQVIYKIYSDSVNNVEEHKRLTKLDLNYKFNKEREIADLELKSEVAKKKLYLILLMFVLLAGGLITYFIRKTNKQKLKLAQNKIELEQIEKLKMELALANRETELKKIVIENSITEEVLNKTLDDIKDIITFENENERKLALRSLSAALLSEKTMQTSTSLQTYLNKVHMDFKIALDTHFPLLKPKEKELLCLMKVGLSNADISKLLSTTLAAVKSNRYRIRKKLNLDSNQDIITYIDSKNV